MFNLASMFVNITAKTDPFEAALRRVQADATRRGAMIGAALGGAINTAIGMALRAGGAAYDSVVTGASDLAETLSKTGVVFGPAAQAVVGQAEQMADAFGLSKTKMLDAASMFGLMAKGAGMSGDAVAGFSNDLVKLAADASSFYNVPMDQALEKIRAGLSGESEPLRAFGVFLSEDAVKAQALAMGLVSSGQALNEQQKIMARAALIAQGLGTATGDLSRTQDGFANQSRKLTGSLSNMASELGTAIMPFFQTLVVEINRTMEAFSGVGATIQETLASAAQTMASWVQTSGVALRNFGTFWEIAQLHTAEYFLDAAAHYEAFAQNLGLVGEWLSNNWVNLIVDAGNAVVSVFQNLGTNIKDLWNAVLEFLSSGQWKFDATPLLNGFKAATAELPKFVDPAIGSVQDRIAEAEARLAASVQEQAGGAAAAKGPAAKTGIAGAATMPIMADQFKSQSFAASDFARDLSGKQFGKDPAAIAQAQLDEQKKAREASERTADATEKLAKATPAALFA